MKVITFYSYKGGVGRTTMLANIAFNLSQRGYKVGCIDFDIESAGLNAMFETVDLLSITTQKLLTFTTKDKIQESIRHGILKVRTNDSDFIYFIPANHSYEETNAATKEIMNNFDDVMKRQKIIIDAFRDLLEVDFLFIDSRAGISPMAIPAIAFADEIVLVYRLGIQQQVGIIALLKYLLNFLSENDEKIKKKIHVLGSNIRRSHSAINDINNFKKWLFSLIEGETDSNGKIAPFDLVHHNPFWRYDYFNDFGSRILDSDNIEDQLALHSIEEICNRVILQ